MLQSLVLGTFLAYAGPAVSDDLFDAFSAFNEQAQVLETLANDAASRSGAHPFAPPEGYALSGEFARRIDQFSDLATGLVVRLDAKGGPKDLRCIYRGMAEDAKRRLAALQRAQNAGAQAVILNGLGALFSDAREVTPQSPAALADHHDEGGDQCTANPGATIEGLPED